MIMSLREFAMGVTVMMALVGGAWQFTWAAEQKTKPEPTTRGAEKPKPSVGEMGLDQLKAKRTEVEDSKTLEDSVKKSALAYLEQAIQFREQLDQTRSEAEGFVQRIKTATERIKEIETELKRPESPDELIQSVIKAPGMDSEKLVQRLGQEKAALVEAKSKLSSIAGQLEKERSRPQELREEIAKAKKRLTELQAELSAAPPAEEPPALTETRRTSLLNEEAKLQVQIRVYDQRLVAQDVLMSLLQAEVDLAALEVKRGEAVIKALETEVQKGRQEEALQAKVEAAVAKGEAAKLPQLIQEEFDVNIKLAQELEKVLRERATLSGKLENDQAQLKSLEEEFALSKSRLKTAVRTEVLGLVLREKRQSLPNFRSYRKESVQRQSKMGEIQNRIVEIDRSRRQLVEMEAETDRIVQLLGPLPDDELQPLKSQIKTMLGDRRALLEKLSSEYNRYFGSLETLEYTAQKLVTEAKAFADFLDMNLMWIRSSRILGPRDLGNLSAALAWLTNPGHWRGVLWDLRDSFRDRPVSWAVGFLFGGVLLMGRRRSRGDLAEVAKSVGYVKSDSFSLTLRALVMTACLATAWPFLLGLVGWQLSALPSPHDFTLGVSKGIKAVALGLALYGFFYYTCCKNGLAQVHFRWPDKARLTLRKNLWWLLWFIVPLAFLVWVETSVAYGDSMGRVAFMVISVAVSVFAARVLRFSEGIVSTMMERSPRGWLVRLRFIWYPLAVGLPLLMGLLAGLGYYYHTALRLAEHVITTYELIIILVIVHHMLLRWLFVARARLAYQEAEIKRAQEKEAMREQQGAEQETNISEEGEAVHVEELEMGLEQIDEQTRALLRAIMTFATLIGMWLIWDQVIPVFQALLDIRLWSYSAEVEGMRKALPITLSNLLLAIVVGAITFAAARNLPGVLEITFLNRFRIDAGARYAFTTIFRYTITGIGIVLAFNVVGFRWSQLQWLIAALGVGIGFGLQEIVANFISGIIILFERPIRVGDIVTVDNTTGRVSRIRIRATAITDWDNKEYIVPNKEFVTGRVLNWTLSSKVNRIVITVGVAYGSDTELARELLLKTAHEHPLIMEDPAPLATFDGFGDNALNFTLRCYLPSMEKRLATINELHMAIDKLFREAGITIAFPQRDVHLDVSGPLNVRVVSGETSAQKSEPRRDPDKEESS